MTEKKSQILNLLLEQDSNEDVLELLADNNFGLVKELFGEDQYRTKFMELKMEEDIKKILKEELKKYDKKTDTSNMVEDTPEVQGEAS